MMEIHKNMMANAKGSTLKSILGNGIELEFDENAYRKTNFR